MRKENWVMMVINVEAEDFLMLHTALEDSDIEVMLEPEPYDHRANCTQKFTGHVFFVPEGQKLEAISVVEQFLEDFQIDKSNFLVVE